MFFSVYVGVNYCESYASHGAYGIYGPYWESSPGEANYKHNYKHAKLTAHKELNALNELFMHGWTDVKV